MPTSYSSAPPCQALSILPSLIAHALHCIPPPFFNTSTPPSFSPCRKTQPSIPHTHPLPPNTPHPSTLRATLYFGTPPPARARSDTLPPGAGGGRDSRAVRYVITKEGKPRRAPLLGRASPRLPAVARRRRPALNREVPSRSEPDRAELLPR